jgi:hypothetical protein
MMIVSRREEIIESVLQFLESGYYDAFHNLAHTTHRKRGCQLLQRPSGLEGIFSLERHAISRVPRVPQHTVVPTNPFTAQYNTVMHAVIGIFFADSRFVLS